MSYLANRCLLRKASLGRCAIDIRDINYVESVEGHLIISYAYSNVLADV